MSSLQKLVQILKKAPKESTVPKQSPPKYKNYLTKQDIKEIRRKASKQFRLPWKGNSIEQRTIHYKRIKGKCLSNWQIDRILISDRSFSKNLKSVKVASSNNQFHPITAKDAQGHLPYLYQSQLPKIKRIQSELYTQSFNPPSKISSSFGIRHNKSFSSNILQRKQSSFN